MQHDLQHPLARPHLADEGGQRGHGGGHRNAGLDLRALCVVCGNDMGKCYANKKFCSPRCRRADQTADEQQARREANARKQCEWCGGPIPPEARSIRRFCCKGCVEKARWQRRRDVELPRMRARYHAKKRAKATA